MLFCLLMSLISIVNINLIRLSLKLKLVWLKASQSVHNDIKSAVEAIDTFPGGSERPRVVEKRYQTRSMTLVIYGDVGERG